MKLEDAKMPDGWFKLEGCSYEDAEALIQTGLMGFCGCGRPDDNLRYVRDGLRHIKCEGRPESSQCGAWAAWWKQHQVDELELFGNQQSAYFFYYWADANGLTEHGGSVPGWLADKGHKVLALLEEALSEGEKHGD